MMRGDGPSLNRRRAGVRPTKSEATARKIVMGAEYQLGDFVDLQRNFAGALRPGPFEIIQLLPNCNGEQHYRVRGPDSAHHVIGRCEIDEARSNGFGEGTLAEGPVPPQK